MTDTIPANFAQRMGLSTSSEQAQASPMDPANVAPIVVFLASECRPKRHRSVHRSQRLPHLAVHPHGAGEGYLQRGPWDLDHLFKVFNSTWEQSTPPEMFKPGSANSDSIRSSTGLVSRGCALLPGCC